MLKPQVLEKNPAALCSNGKRLDGLSTGRICQLSPYSPDNSILQEKYLSLAHTISLSLWRLVWANVISYSLNWLVNEYTVYVSPMNPEGNPFHATTSGPTFLHASAQMPLVTLETSASHDAVSQFTPGIWRPSEDKAWSLYYAGKVVGS